MGGQGCSTDQKKGKSLYFVATISNHGPGHAHHRGTHGEMGGAVRDLEKEAQRVLLNVVRSVEEGLFVAGPLALLLAELERLVRQVGAQRTFQDQADLQNAIEDVIEVFPSLKLEEILLAFKAIRQGRFQLYGTFNTLTLIDCIRKYEMENTVPLRERAHKQTQNDVETTCIDWARLARDLQLDGKLQRPKKTLDRYIPLPNNLESFDEIEDWRAKHIKTEEKDEET